MFLSSSHPAARSAEPRYPPVFDRKLSPQEVTVGDSIELECHVTGSAPIKVTWSKDHKDIRTGGNYKISCVDNTAHLTILKADKADTGRYFCHASNDMGKDSCSSDVAVKGTFYPAHTLIFYLGLLSQTPKPPLGRFFMIKNKQLLLLTVTSLIFRA